MGIWLCERHNWNIVRAVQIWVETLSALPTKIMWGKPLSFAIPNKFADGWNLSSIGARQVSALEQLYITDTILQCDVNHDYRMSVFVEALVLIGHERLDCLKNKRNRCFSFS